jgi:hypothetical protein
LENDNTLEVPATLIPFLYQARGWRWLKSRTLWIDSVCLNQKDDDEKTANVPKMREIYMKASLTMSWLGPEAEGIAAAFDYASRLVKNWRHEMAEQKQTVLTVEEEKEEYVRLQVKVGDPALETLLHLLERPYFERAWIMQELVVSSRVWFMCGSALISWSSLLAAYMYLVATQLWLWEFYNSVRVLILMVIKLSELEWANGADLDWPGTLLRHRVCFSGDSRDKVYAFYGMRCRKALEELGIEPNYEKSTTTEVVYTRLAARTLHKAQVAVLHVPRLVTTSHEDSDRHFERLVLPSWVPDWRWTEATPMSLLTAEVLSIETNVAPEYYASKDSVFEPGFDVEAYNSPSNPVNHLNELPMMLRLYGVTVAEVTQLTPRPWVTPKTSVRQSLLERAQTLQFNQQQVHEWEVLFRNQRTPQIYAATGEPVTRAMYETFMAGTTQYTPEIKLSAWKAFEKRQNILRLLHTFRIHGFLVCYVVVVLVDRLLRRFGRANPEMQFRSMVGHMLNRKGAQMVNIQDSRMAYYALVPGICQLGDCVVLVGGVTTPLILRKKEQGAITTWEFIGDAYVHGMMKGELWDESKGDRKYIWIA